MYGSNICIMYTLGPMHQAGSDSLLTAFTFFRMREKCFENDLSDDKFVGGIYLRYYYTYLIIYITAIHIFLQYLYLWQ